MTTPRGTPTPELTEAQKRVRDMLLRTPTPTPEPSDDGLTEAQRRVKERLQTTTEQPSGPPAQGPETQATPTSGEAGPVRTPGPVEPFQIRPQFFTPEIDFDRPPPIRRNIPAERFEDLTTPAEPGTFLSRSPELRGAETALDFLNLLALPAEFLGEQARDPTPRGFDPLRDIERFEQRPLAEQIVTGGIVDPLNLIPGVGVAPFIGRGARGAARGAEGITLAEPLVERAGRFLSTRGERPLARLAGAERQARGAAQRPSPIGDGLTEIQRRVKENLLPADEVPEEAATPLVQARQQLTETLARVGRQRGRQAQQQVEQAQTRVRVEENALAERQIQTSDVADAIPDAQLAVPRFTNFRLLEEGRASLAPSGDVMEGGLQEVLGGFREFINNPARGAEWRQTLLMRTSERGRRFGNYQNRVNELVSQGVSVEDADRVASRELAGQLPTADVPLHQLATPWVREALFQEVYTQLAGDPVKMRSTLTALTRALSTGRIPRDPGTRGGSSLTLLQDVFGRELTQTLGSGRTLEEIIALQTREGLGLTGFRGPSVPFIEQPSTQGFGSARIVDRGRGTEQVFGDVPGERLFTEAPLQGQQAPLQHTLPGEAFPTRPPDPRPQGQREIDLQILREMVGEADVPTGITPELRRLMDLPPEEIIRQATFIPETTKEQMIRYARNAGLTTMDLGNLLRANLATVDLSYLRQQALLIPGNPVPFAQSFKDALRSLFSADYARQIDNWIKTDPDFRYYDELDIDFLRALDSKVAKDWEKAEDFMVMGGNRPLQRLAQRIPWINISGRAYVTGMNSMNWRIFKGHMRMMHRMNEEIAAGRMVMPSGQVLDINDSARRFGAMLADFSGRGPLRGRVFGQDIDVRSAAPILNNVFFSTRLNLGRFLTPRHLWSPDKHVRRAAWKNMVTGVGAIGGLVKGGEMMGWWETELDPRSSDVGKIRIGNVRIDPWGGFQQYAVLTWRLISSIREANQKSTADGDLSFRQPSDLIGQFARSKLAPGISQALIAWTGRDFIGREIDRKDWRFWLNQNTPISVQDVLETYEEEGLLGVGLGSLSFLGIGVQVHEQRKPETFRFRR